MQLQIIFFVLIISITTFALSLLTARIYALGLKMGSKGKKNASIIGILFPIIFVGGNILGRYGDGIFVRGVTIFSDILAGFALYALLTGIVLGIILFIGRLAHLKISKNLAVFFLILVFLLGLVGVIQARTLKVVSYSISLPGAPESWEGKKAVLVSDTHYGLVNYYKFSKKITDKIISLNPDFVMHAGDLYDGPAIDSAPLIDDWKRLSERFPVFFAPGNHDEYGPYNEFIDSTKKAGFTVLDDKKVLYEGVEIVGITYRGKRDEVSAKNAIYLLKLDKATSSILINHSPIFQEYAISAGVDLMVSGHTHRGQFWPLGYIVRAIYGKYIYGKNVDDTLTTITTSGVGTAGPPLRLFNTPEIVLITFSR